MNEKGGKGGKDGGKNSWQKAAARMEAKGKRKVARENPERVGRVAKQVTSQPVAVDTTMTFFSHTDVMGPSRITIK